MASSPPFKMCHPILSSMLMPNYGPLETVISVAFLQGNRVIFILGTRKSELLKLFDLKKKAQCQKENLKQQLLLIREDLLTNYH